MKKEMTKEEKIQKIGKRLYEMSDEVFEMCYELEEYDREDYRVGELKRLYDKMFITKCNILHKPE